MTGVARYLLFFVLVFFPACATVRYCPIETLQPAKLTFNRPIKNIAICAPKTLLLESVMYNRDVTSVPADSLIANILFSLQQSWKEAPGYENATFHTYILQSDELLGASNFDIIVRLDKLAINNEYDWWQYGYSKWEAYLYVQYAVKWQINNEIGQDVGSYIDRDLIVWPSGLHDSRSAARANLPDVEDAWWDMGISLAQNCAARITPQWRTEMRDIYMINKYPELSQKAYTAMQNDGHARAFDIWENMLLSCRKSGQKRIKSQIIYNMAVASEFQNELAQAETWAYQSVNFLKKKRNVDYLELLQKRIIQHKKLDLQITP